MYLKKAFVARTVFPVTAMTSSVTDRFINTQLNGVRSWKDTFIKLEIFMKSIYMNIFIIKKFTNILRN